METLGLYVQIPFCASKCSFCNFSSRVERASAVERYAQALLGELASLGPLYAAAGIPEDVLDLPVDSLYIGGGTPPLLGEERLEQLIRALHSAFSFSEQVEFTLEVTPGSASTEFLRKLAGLGLNRLSIGAQTFDDRELKVVGRLHSAEDTSELVHAARRAGIGNISLDLIAGLPFQTEQSWKASLDSALALRPQHLSVYLFEIDEKSRLGREVLQHGERYHADSVPDDEFMADAYETARERLRRAGYEQYEISNFSLPGFESRHNLRYWRLEPYVGLGAGAHSFDAKRRWANQADPAAYAAGISSRELLLAELRTLSKDEQLEEFFFLGLRERRGVDLALARERWGSEAIERVQPALGSLERDGLIEREGDRARLAERSYLISNEVFQEFVGVAS